MKPTIYNFSASWNLGDQLCSPNLYFDWIKDCSVKSPWDWTPGPSIFGAGGMLHPGTDTWIKKAVESTEQTAIWGIGLNYHDQERQVFPEWLNKCALVGMREHNNPWNYVPCPSCMCGHFDELIGLRPTTRVVVYHHRDYPIATRDFTSMTNSCPESESVMKFLASARIVITNTFHGAYWSQLIGRKVILVKPFSNRFMALKGITPSNGTNLSRDIEYAEAEPLPTPTLEDCRKLNREWSDKLREYFHI